MIFGVDPTTFGLDPTSFSSDPFKIQPNLYLYSDPVKIYHHHSSIDSTEPIDPLPEPNLT